MEAFLEIPPLEWTRIREDVAASGTDADLWAARLARLTPSTSIQLDDLLEEERQLGYWD